MKLTVLCDNNTYINKYLLGEPAFSIYIENEDDKILFDTGYSNVFLKNAEKLGIDLTKVNKVALSHGHDDHSNGLVYINHKPELYYVEGCFEYKIGSKADANPPYTEDEIKEKFNAIKVDNCTEISKNLFYLGEIPRVTEFEKTNPNLKVKKNDKIEIDELKDDTALVFNGEEGLYVITGCSHSGICNILSYAKKIFNKEIKLVIGGFHLRKLDDSVQRAIDFLKNENIEKLYPCHCTTLDVKCEMKNRGLNVLEVGSGLSLEIK
ncbi:MAG: MBL fold metallo-hydrolase [Clostridia bacterium]|nr:MBL fold metallo-hydrolase [Clostridia bacterium]